MPIRATSLRCLCGAVHEDASVRGSPELPIPTEICDCNPCRQTSGALCPAFVKLESEPASLAACKRYNFSGKTHRYFCTACGSRTFDYTTKSDAWFACSGIVEPQIFGANVIKVTSHDYVADTNDGGLAANMQQIGGRLIPCYAGGRDQQQMTSAELMQCVEQSPSLRESKLFASCHCSSIKFNILPPNANGADLSDPAVKRWLRADRTKYLALNCACTYCRRAVGFSFASYTYIMPENIVTVDNKHQSLFDYTSHNQETSDLASSTTSLQAFLPALKFYFSSAGIRRSFCGICGASIFFERSSRPQCVNVAVGILRAESGSLAKDWIDFDWEVCWRDEAVDNELVVALEAWMEWKGTK